MVVSPKINGVISVILADGEYLPQNLNSEKVLVFRQGDSTGRQLEIIKEFGKLADPGILKSEVEKICNYSGDGNPLHQHEDQSWWYYDETWAYENGPFDSYDLGWESLEQYCQDLSRSREFSLTLPSKDDSIAE